MKQLTLSKTIAFILGILIPSAETVRRWNQLGDISNFMSWFDDYMLGAVLLSAAYATHKNPVNGQRFLIAAWGVAVGGMFLSMLGHFSPAFKEASGYNSMMVAAIKGVLLAVCMGALAMSLKKVNPEVKE